MDYIDAINEVQVHKTWSTSTQKMKYKYIEKGIHVHKKEYMYFEITKYKYTEKEVFVH
jgi:hypothetical protein